MRGRPFNLWLLLLVAILIAWAVSLGSPQEVTGTLPYSTFLNEIDAGRVREVVIQGDRLSGRRRFR